MENGHSKDDEAVVVKIIMKVRKYKGGDKVVDVYLIERAGAADSCLLYGSLKWKTAQAVIDEMTKMGLEVEIEKSPLPYVSAQQKN
jgi:hypothetical protein